MQFEAPGTLARIVGSPLRRKRKFALSAEAFGKVLIAANKSKDPVLPDSEAVRFYALNQMMSGLFQQFTANERLPDWAQSIAHDYEQELTRQHLRLTWYTFLVICREFRHLQQPKVVMNDLKFTMEMKAFQPQIKDDQSEASLNSWLLALPNEPVHAICRNLAAGFNTKGHWGGGYGGPPWGQIATTLAEMFDGNTSAEIFIDTAYTLAHNNGPMFNKGMLYKHYDQQHFKEILDVQRSGQVCEGVLSGQITGWVSVVNAQELRQQIVEYRKHRDDIGEYIDWNKVEALGALGKYTAYKAAQTKKHGKPQKTLFNGVPIKNTNTFMVFPGQEVQIYERLSA